MTKEEFFLKQILDNIKDSIDGVKETMTQQHTGINVRLEMLLDKHAVTDKKVDKAFSIIDTHGADIVHIKDIANRALELGEDYNDNKKKVIWGAAGFSAAISGIAAMFAWLFK